MSSFKGHISNVRSLKRKKFFYGWWVVLSGVFLITFMSLCVFRGMGVVLVVLQNNFKWSRTQISIGTLLSRVEGAALGPDEGVLIDKIGARMMILIGFSVMAIGFVLFSRINNIWHFYVTFIIITLGSGIGGWLAVITVLNNWFVKNRSKAMAGAMSGIYIAGFFLPLYAIAMETSFRGTALILGLLLLVVVIPCAKLIRNSPEDLGLLPDGDGVEISEERNKGTVSSKEVNVAEEFTAKEALRTSAFWLLTFAHLCSTVSITTLSLHLTPRLTDMGLDLTVASSIETLYSAVAIPSLFISGWLGDRFSKRLLIGIFLFIQGASVIILAFANGLPLALLFAVLYGIAFGGRTPLMTAIRGDYFGRGSFATIMGWSMLPNGILMAVAPVWAGWMFDNYGSYMIPFFVFGMANLVGVIAMVFVRRPTLLQEKMLPNLRK